MNYVASNVVQVRNAVFRDHLTFDPIYEKLTPGEKNRFLNAFKDDRIVIQNMVNHDESNARLICPACCLDIHTKNLPWSSSSEKRNGIRLGEVNFRSEHLVLKTKLVKWSDLATHDRVEGDYYCVKMERSKDELTSNVRIRNTRSKINNIAPGDGKWLYDQIFKDVDFEWFRTVGELKAHFKRCHEDGAIQPKPDRLFKTYQRNQGEMELRLFPLWDLPLSKDSEHNFDPWTEIRFHQYYVRRHVTSRQEFLSTRTDWQMSRLMATIRHKGFRAYSLMPQVRSPITTRGRYLSQQESTKLYHIKMVFHFLVKKSLNQQLFNLNMMSVTLQPIANLVVINDFLEEYFIQEFGMPFEEFINW